MNDHIANKSDEVLLNEICEKIERADLDAHLACLALTYTFHDLQRTPFAKSIQTLQSLSVQQFESPRLRPHDVAVAGVRLALGWKSGQAHKNFEKLCEIEIRRNPLPPLETIATDPRLLLGIAAGVAQVDSCHTQKRVLWTLAENFRDSRNLHPWQYVLACWTQRLLSDDDEYSSVSEDLSRYLLNIKIDLSTRDRAAIMWAISHCNLLLPTAKDAKFSELEKLNDDLREVAHRNGQLFNDVETLEMAFLYDAMASNPSSLRQRSRAVQAILDVIEVFDRVAMRLRNDRRKGKEPFIITDEYDVQDLFFAMLLSALPDLEPEDPTIKDAGSSKRIDFISKQGRVGVELKHIEKLDKKRNKSSESKKAKGVSDDITALCT